MLAGVRSLQTCMQALAAVAATVHECTIHREVPGGRVLAGWCAPPRHRSTLALNPRDDDHLRRHLQPEFHHDSRRAVRRQLRADPEGQVRRRGCGRYPGPLLAGCCGPRDRGQSVTTSGATHTVTASIALGSETPKVVHAWNGSSFTSGTYTYASALAAVLGAPSATSGVMTSAIEPSAQFALPAPGSDAAKWQVVSAGSAGSRYGRPRVPTAQFILSRGTDALMPRSPDSRLPLVQESANSTYKNENRVMGMLWESQESRELVLKWLHDSDRSVGR